MFGLFLSGKLQSDFRLVILISNSAIYFQGCSWCNKYWTGDHANNCFSVTDFTWEEFCKEEPLPSPGIPDHQGSALTCYSIWLWSHRLLIPNKVDSTQEMIALGVTNISNSFVFGAFPVTAAMSRSAVNYQANAATQLSAWVTAILIVISLAFIVNIFVYIPAAALAGIIIEAAVGKGFRNRISDCLNLKMVRESVTKGFLILKNGRKSGD